MIYASTKSNKKSTILPKKKHLNDKSVIPSFQLPPVNTNPTSQPIYGDTIGKQMSHIENNIDKLYSTNMPPDIKNLAINRLMSKLRKLAVFRKRKISGVYQISKAPAKNTMYNPEKKERKKIKRNKRNPDFDPNSVYNLEKTFLDDAEPAKKKQRRRSRKTHFIDKSPMKTRSQTGTGHFIKWI